MERIEIKDSQIMGAIKSRIKLVIKIKEMTRKVFQEFTIKIERMDSNNHSKKEILVIKLMAKKRCYPFKNSRFRLDCKILCLLHFSQDIQKY